MISLRPLMAAAATVALAACVSGPPRVVPAPQTSPPLRPPVSQGVPPQVSLPPPTVSFMAPEIMRERGLDNVIRQDGPSLLRRFGTPRLETFEGDMRKLQFSGEACVLDVFLYPLTAGGEPVATWVEARRSSDGAQVDRSACVAALSRR